MNVLNCSLGDMHETADVSDEVFNFGDMKHSERAVLRITIEA